MTTTKTVPMKMCPSKWIHEHPDYCHCNGTGQVEDMDKEVRPVFIRPCRDFKRYGCDGKHKFQSQPCPSCKVYEIILPVSEAVYNKCDYWSEKCDGCIAYMEHY